MSPPRRAMHAIIREESMRVRSRCRSARRRRKPRARRAATHGTVITRPADRARTLDREAGVETRSRAGVPCRADGGTGFAEHSAERLCMRSIRKIVVLGANGAMGSASGAVFAAAGVPTVFLAKTLDKAEAGRARAEQLTRGKLSHDAISCGTYASDLGHELADADLVFEAVSEDMATKRELFALI